jgi:hypothetical protein
MGSFKHPQTGTYQVKLQYMIDMQGRVALQRGLHFAGIDIIGILFADGRKSGMELQIGLGNAEDSDRRGQQRIEATLQSLAGNCGMSVKMGYHAFCMHTGIGTPSSMQKDFFTGNQPESTLDFSLDGPAVGLPLPAAKVRAIVSYLQANGTEGSYIFHEDK